MGFFLRIWCVILLFVSTATDGSRDLSWAGISGASGSSDQGALVYLVPLSQLRALVTINDLKGFDVSSPAVVGSLPVILTTGTASASGSAQLPPDIAPPQDSNMTPPGMGPGGPWDLSYINDPSQFQMPGQGQNPQGPQFPSPNQISGQSVQDSPAAAMTPGLIQLTAPSGTSITVQQPSPYSGPQTFDIGHYYRNQYPLQYSGFPPPQMTNKATGNVINAGSALQGALSANGDSKTQTGPDGSSSFGDGQLGGSGSGIQGTSVNTAGSNTGGIPTNLAAWFPNGSPFGPTSGSANSMFLNSLTAAKGTVNGNSDTQTQTGLNGNSFGSSSGSASGHGQGIQLTQVASSDSEGSGYADSPYGSGPSPFGNPRYKRALPSWSSLFGLPSPGMFPSSPAIPAILAGNGTAATRPYYVGVSSEMDPTTGGIVTYYTTAVFKPLPLGSAVSTSGGASNVVGGRKR